MENVYTGAAPGLTAYYPELYSFAAEPIGAICTRFCDPKQLFYRNNATFYTN
jgi:hypothetical protein